MIRLWKIPAAALLVMLVHTAAAAQPPTATPAPLDLLTLVPQAAQEVTGATPTWTPTPEGQVMIQARDFANVRAEPDIDAAQLGQIRSGDLYPATGRHFEWIQFQFDQTRRGWVFGQLVEAIGDVNSLPEIGEGAITEVITEEVGPVATLAAVTLTPGGILTLTAAARQVPAGDAPGNADAPQGAGPILPTFTYPPGIVALAPTTDINALEPTPQSGMPALDDVSTTDIPPIVPMLVLGGVGLLGLAISSLRR